MKFLFVFAQLEATVVRAEAPKGNLHCKKENGQLRSRSH